MRHYRLFKLFFSVEESGVSCATLPLVVIKLRTKETDVKHYFIFNDQSQIIYMFIHLQFTSI